MTNSTRPHARTKVLSGLVLAFTATAIPAQKADDGRPEGPPLPYKKAIKKYRAYLKRKSLMKRTEGRMVLAHTKDSQALEVLAASYGKTEDPQDQVRYLIVEIVLRYFQKASAKGPFAAWRGRFTKARDAWLWYRTLRAKFMAEHKDELIAIVKNKSKTDVFLRAAALEALAGLVDGKSEEPEIADAIAGILQVPPEKKDLDTAVLYESCAAVVLAQKEQVRTDKWKPICAALIETLNHENALTRTKLALSRRFAKLFDVTNLGFEPRLWNSKLNQGAPPKRSDTGGTRAAFFGVRSLGTRICYVIDASDSMLKPVTKQEKDRLAALTGPRKKAGSANAPIEDRLPWDKIKTRFDVAREYLKLSLQGLDKSTGFAVILFGDEAAPLKSTPRIITATKGNVRKVIAELNKIKSRKSNNPQRPHGELRGRTNMHAGLLQAFRITKSKVVRKDEYVNKKTFDTGCDTIYLLSDGEPSWDSYGAMDKRDEGDGVADPESGATFQSKQKRGFYWGPYGRTPHQFMLEDFHRLNLFRKVQIHCVGIGEADQGLLDKISEIGLGKVVKLTPPGKK